MDKIIYKICNKTEWNEAKEKGVYEGSTDDLRDGFIHLSRASQVKGTLLKHFKDQENLLLIAVDTQKIQETLKYEESRGGELFPHIHGTLEFDAVIWEKDIIKQQDGTFVLPEIQ